MTAQVTEAELVVARPFALEVDEVVRELHADRAGLTATDAEARLAVVGPNLLPEPKRTPAIVRFFSHFNDTLIYILLGAAAVKAIMGDWLDFWVIMAVAIINAVVGYIQEGRAEKALAGIRGMLSADASARRGGGWITVPAAELVPGDVVRLMPGDKVPADVRLFQAFQLRVDESALTGESVPSSKQIDPVAPDAGVGDRSSMAFSGTIVSAGQARGIVTATGSDTEIGKIQSLADEAGALATPLTQQLDGFGRVLTVVILGMAAVMLLIGRFLHQMPLDDLVSAAIGFAVAAIPEGLPALVTITLALGVQQMARRNAITRKLPAVEALGSVTTVCSDKTGTLTKNEMTVRRIVTPLARYEVTGLGYDPVGEIRPVDGARARGDLTAVLAVASLCNDAHVVRDADGRWQLVGEPTEGALKVVAMKGRLDPGAGSRLAVIPFDSANKFMATLNQGADGSRAILVKGAPDRLLERSLTQRGEAGAEPLDVVRWAAVIDELSGEGLRVLAAARKPIRSDIETIEIDDLQDLEFLGVWGIVDPPRPEAVEAIADCHAAGIAVKMITGDHAGTALAIGREMGLVSGDDVRVLTGTELEALTQEQLKEVVRALQSHGEVVAMTGDGVNDAPALTRANVGIAMGIKGTEATKEAAEFVLADDNFATIRSAIAEGRRIYDNLRQSIVFLPPTSVQVLWVHMVTAVTLSLALAYEPAEVGIMARPPRRTGGSIISGSELAFVLIVSALIGGAAMGVFYGAAAAGTDVAHARTEAVLMLALGQLAFLLNCRFMSRSSITVDVFRGNRVVWISAAALIFLQLLFTYLPVMNTLFESEPLAAASWIVPIFFAVEILKAVFRRR